MTRETTHGRRATINEGSTGGYDRESSHLNPNGFVDQLTRYRPFQDYDGRNWPASKNEDTAIRNAEVDMGRVGYLVRTLDRTGSRYAWALIRASEEEPNTTDPYDKTTNDLLLSRALQVNGNGKYTGPKALFNIPEGRGIGVGLYNVMDKLHLLFMQEGAFILRNAERQGLLYLEGKKDPAERQAVETMIHSGNYTRVQEIDAESKPIKDSLVGIIPEGHSRAGETVRVELLPLSRLRTEIHAGADYQTTEGLKHGIAVGDTDKKGEAANPVGWVGKVDDGKILLADQNTTIRMFGLEHLRRKGYKVLPPDDIQELDNIGLGSTIVPLDNAKQPDVPIQKLIDTSDNGLLNRTNAWATMYDVMHELSASLSYDPTTTYADTLKRIRESLNANKEQVNAILTGHVIGQMIEALYPSLPDEYADIKTSIIPSEKTQDTFQMTLEKTARPEESLPIWYQIAQFLELETAEQIPAIDDQGRLASPDIDQRAASTILSVGVIAIEQMLLQYLIPGTIRYGRDSAFGQDLDRVAHAIGKPDFVDAVEVETKVLDNDTVYGRQRSECENLLDMVRSYTETATVIDVIKSDDYERFRNDPDVFGALRNMQHIGNIMYESPFASEAFKRGGGLNVGLDLVANQYSQ